MNKKKMIIWGREFPLDICLECYEGEEVLDSQTEALKNLLKSEKAINAAKADVEKYIIANNKSAFPSGEMDNIFKYVIPRSIFVPHSKKKQQAAIFCNYKFDREHGLALVFENGKLVKVTSEDCVI